MRNDDRHAPPSAARLSAAPLLVAAGYWAGTQLGLFLTPSALAVSVLWPPNAILFGALLLAPRSHWHWYLLAVLPVHLGTQLLDGIPLLTSVGWFVTNTGEALLGALLLRRFRQFPIELFETFVGVLFFLGVGVVGTVGVSSLLDAAVVTLTGAGQGYREVFQHRFASNALATLTLVPSIVMLGSSSVAALRAVPRTRYLEGGLLALGTLYAVNVLFASHGQTQTSVEGLAYTVLLPLMFWAAVRFGPAGVSILQLFATFAVLWPTAGSAAVSMRDVLSLQLFVAVLNGLSLVLAVVVRESRRLQSLHSAVLKSMPNAVAITDSAGVVIDANDSWIAAGRSNTPGRLDGAAVHEHYLERQRLAGATSAAGRLATGLEEVLAGTRDVFEMEYSCRTADDLKWFAMSVVPLSGEQRGAVITHADITRRKHEEVATIQLREDLSHAGRVMTMGMLSASLTHELSQPLAAILGNAQAARRLCARNEGNDTAEVDVILEDIVAASRRAGGILRRLRSWFSNGRHDVLPLSLNDVADEVIEILRSDLTRRGVLVTTRLAPALPAVNGDRVQLQQVVLNLILNSCDAMSDNAPGDRHVLVTTTHSPAGVQLSVEDVGAGIAPDRLGSLFEPFVTTKATGLGLGLALCKSIVHAHEGRLTAENNAGRGATFHCTLPLAASREPAVMGS